MIKPRQPASPLHVLPAVFLYAAVLAFLDLASIMEMPRSLAIGIYSGQLAISLAVYFGLLIGNFMDVSTLPTSLWSGRSRFARRFLSYFVFMIRVAMLSTFEAGSILMLARPTTGITNEQTTSLMPLLLLPFLGIHMLVECNRLGDNAWSVCTEHDRP